jgi:hypothetical protein
MRAFAFSLIALLSLVELRAAEPRFRPALIGNGPKALVNVINTQRLVEKGQRDSLLMFKSGVSRLGEVRNCFMYRETPGSKLLKEEMGNALRACRFIPAIYNGERTDVIFAGTVVFAVRDGKPHLRIYANQNHDDIEKGNDFIAPQVVVNTIDYVRGRYDLAAQEARVNLQNGAVEISITVDSNGNQKDIKVVSEDPPGFGLGNLIKDVYAKARWIPGFRNGRVVECRFDYAEWFFALRQWEQQQRLGSFRSSLPVSGHFSLLPTH